MAVASWIDRNRNRAPRPLIRSGSEIVTPDAKFRRAVVPECGSLLAVTSNSLQFGDSYNSI